MMLREALWPSEGDTDAIIHADKTDCPMFGFGDGSADGSIVEKWNICSSDDEDDFPSDGSCIRCGSVPRNASGLCNTCLDEDAARLENTRPAPAAPVDGLERYRPEPMSLGGMVRDPDGDYVTRSQAEELLAAERAKTEELRRAIMGKEPDPDLQHGNFLEMAATLHRACDGGLKRAEYAEQRLGQSEAELKQARADNAAKEARIKELDLQLSASKETAKIKRVEYLDLDQDHSELKADYAVSEAQLKAARKALEPFADVANLIDAETEGMAETDELVLHFHDYEFAKWPVSFFRKARAARGGKPS